MSKGFWVSVVSYSLFIVLPFVYLLMTVHTMLTSHSTLTAQIDSRITQPDTHLYRSYERV